MTAKMWISTAEIYLVSRVGKSTCQQEKLTKVCIVEVHHKKIVC